VSNLRAGALPQGYSTAAFPAYTACRLLALHVISKSAAFEQQLTRAESRSDANDPKQKVLVKLFGGPPFSMDTLGDTVADRFVDVPPILDRAR
jgi:hypothetical protein